MRTIVKSYLAVIALFAVACAQPALAQVDSVTTTPTKVYATVGGGFSFSSSYTSEGFSTTDLLIDYTANTSSPSLVPFASCIDAATPAPYDGAQPNTKYVNFDAGIAIFPTAAACGGQATVTLGTFSGTVASFPAGGSYSIVVFNNNAGGASNVTANDVLVCQKVTVSSVTAPADAFEGTAQTFTVTFAPAVPVGCGGFAIPVTLSGTATAAPDNVVITTNNCTSIPDAATTCTVIVQGVDDAIADGNKVATLTVTDSTASSAYVSTGKTANGNVLDNEISGSVSATNASETGPTNGVVTFSRGGATTGALDLTSAITGTATYTTDYSLTAGTCAIVSQSASSITVTVPIGAASCTVNLVPVDDVIVETGGETVIFAPPTGANVTPTGLAATVLIADNDALPAIALTKAGTCAEALVPVNCTFTVTATTNTSPAQTGNGPLVPFTLTGTATNNTDYKLVNGTLCTDPAFAGPIQTVFGTPTTLTVCVIDDAIVESGGETVILTLTANAASYTLTAPASQTQTIADDDSPQLISVSATTPAIAEAAGTTTFVFTRSGGSLAAQGAALTVNVTLGGTATFGASCAAGVDYTLVPVAPATASLAAAPRTVTFAASILTAAVTITACDDSLMDPDETAILTVAPPTVATDYTVATAPANTATVTITDDEVGLSVSVISDANEGGQPGIFRVCRSVSSASPQTVNGAFSGTASTPTDFTATGITAGVITIPAGTLCADVTITVVDDLLINPGRSIILTITSPGAPAVVTQGTATMGINDNDQPKIIPTLSPVTLMFLGLFLAGFAGFTLRKRSL